MATGCGGRRFNPRLPWRGAGGLWQRSHRDSPAAVARQAGRGARHQAAEAPVREPQEGHAGELHPAQSVRQAVPEHHDGDPAVSVRQADQRAQQRLGHLLLGHRSPAHTPGLPGRGDGPPAGVHQEPGPGAAAERARPGVPGPWEAVTDAPLSRGGYTRTDPLANVTTQLPRRFITCTLYNVYGAGCSLVPKVNDWDPGRLVVQAPV